MKYMTKEWFDASQKSGFYLTLKASKKAETFSEEFYQELYKREEKKYLKMAKDFFETDIETAFDEFIEEDFCDDDEEFDPEKEKENFKFYLRNSLKNYKSLFPEDVFKKVADTRVLALGVVSPEVKADITKYCKDNEKMVKRAMKECSKQFQKEFKSGAPDFARMDLHDCQVTSFKKKGKNYILSVDNSDGFTDITEVRFVNCKIVKQDAPLHGAWYLYDEIYKVDDHYEIHALLMKKELIDLIIEADDVVLK